MSYYIADREMNMFEAEITSITEAELECAWVEEAPDNWTEEDMITIAQEMEQAELQASEDQERYERATIGALRVINSGLAKLYE